MPFSPVTGLCCHQGSW